MFTGPRDKDEEEYEPEDYEALIDEVEEQGGIEASVEAMYGEENTTDGDPVDEED